LDSLEAAVVRKEVTSLVITIQGYTGRDQPISQAQNNKEGIDINGISTICADTESKTQIQLVAFSSAQGKSTKNDVLETIKNFKAMNPNGNVIIAGHSLGVDNAVELVNEHPEIKVDLLTVDICDDYDDDIPRNVKNAVNIYCSDDRFLGR
jgi:hypothetical protein